MLIHFYFPKHRQGAAFSPGEAFTCKAGCCRHVGFPGVGFWMRHEGCYSWAFASGGTGEDDGGSFRNCPACERPLKHLFLCQSCGLLTGTEEGKPTPGPCTGCGNPFPPDLFRHGCPILRGVALSTARSPCPLCGTALPEKFPVDFPQLPSAILRQVERAVQGGLFDGSQEWRVGTSAVLLFSRGESYFAVPARDTLRSAEEFFGGLSVLFDCSRPTAGSLTVRAPAEVGLANQREPGSARVLRKGALEIVPEQAPHPECATAGPASPPPASAPPSPDEPPDRAPAREDPPSTEAPAKPRPEKAGPPQFPDLPSRLLKQIEQAVLSGAIAATRPVNLTGVAGTAYRIGATWLAVPRVDGIADAAKFRKSLGMWFDCESPGPGNFLVVKPAQLRQTPGGDLVGIARGILEMRVSVPPASASAGRGGRSAGAAPDPAGPGPTSARSQAAVEPAAPSAAGTAPGPPPATASKPAPPAKAPPRTPADPARGAVAKTAPPSGSPPSTARKLRKFGLWVAGGALALWVGWAGMGLLERKRFLPEIDRALAENRLFLPKGDCAWDSYCRRKAREPGDPQLAVASRKIGDRALQFGESAFRRYYESNDKDLNWASVEKAYGLLGASFPEVGDYMAKYVFAQAQRAYAAKDYQRAYELYGKALSLKPNWVLAVMGMGKVRMHSARTLRDEDQAVRLYQVAASLDPSYSWAYRSIAENHANRKRWAEAEAAMRRAVAAGPEVPSHLRRLGDFCAQNRKYSEAIRHYQKSLTGASDPDDKETLLKIARLREKGWS